MSDPSDFMLVSDPDTRIEALIMQVQNIEDPFLFDLLAAMRKEIKFIIMIRDRSQTDELWGNLKRRKISRPENRIRFILNEKKRIRKWARDPYIVLCNPKSTQFTLIPSYSSDETGPNWISEAIIGTDVDMTSLVRNDFEKIPTWNVEGGGIVSDNRYAYVGQDTIFYSRRKGEDKAKYSREEAVQSIEKITSKKIIVLPAADTHIDRYHIPIGETAFGERTSLLADPVALLEIVRSLTPREKERAIKYIQEYGAAYKNQKFFRTPEGVDEMAWMESFLDRSDLYDFLNMSDEQFENLKNSIYVDALDRAEKILTEKGITVVRIPALSHSYEVEEWNREKGKLDLDVKKHFFPLGFYYTNILQDKHKGARTAIIPKYGINKLDAYVKNKFESLKAFQKIRQIRCVIEGTQGGGPRCRVQVLGFPDSSFEKSK